MLKIITANKRVFSRLILFRKPIKLIASERRKQINQRNRICCCCCCYLWQVKYQTNGLMLSWLFASNINHIRSMSPLIREIVWNDRLFFLVNLLITMMSTQVTIMCLCFREYKNSSEYPMWLIPNVWLITQINHTSKTRYLLTVTCIHTHRILIKRTKNNFSSKNK